MVGWSRICLGSDVGPPACVCSWECVRSRLVPTLRHSACWVVLVLTEPRKPGDLGPHVGGHMCWEVIWKVKF